MHRAGRVRGFFTQKKYFSTSALAIQNTPCRIFIQAKNKTRVVANFETETVLVIKIGHERQ